MATHQNQSANQAKKSAQKQPTARPVDRVPGAPTLQADAPTLRRAVENPGVASPRDILTLQRLYGNRAVTRLLQAKLTVGPAGDRYEREADSVADRVMTMRLPSAERVQRQEDEEEIQTKSLLQTTQPSAFRLPPSVQRQEDEEEIQTRPADGGGFRAGEGFERRLGASQGGGSPLPGEVRAFMEPRFGADFGGVRVHTDAEAGQLNREINAQAFTHGQDIYMGAGRYDPGSDAGKHLLAHELTHVVQQGGSKVSPKSEDLETVQRKVGFEFEEENWRSWKKTLLGVRPARRKEVLHKGHGFQLEADDTFGVNQPDIEFVTEPFDTTMSGLADLSVAMNEIRTIMTRIGPFRGRDETNDEYVTKHEHQLSGSGVRLSRGHSVGMFKVQATSGIALEDMPTFMQYFGTNVPGETVAETGERQRARDVMGPAPTSYTNLMGSAPTLAQNAINAFLLATGLGAPVFANTAALKGFLSQVIVYIKMLSAPNTLWVKYMLPLLARSDFAALYGLLPLNQRQDIGAHFNALVTAVINAANGTTFLTNLGGADYDAGLVAGNPLLLRTTLNGNPVMPSLTINDWLHGIVAQRKDYLRPVNAINWMKANEPGLNKSGRKEVAERLESVASLGGKTNAAERMGTTGLGIFENRGIAPLGAYFGAIAGAGKLTPTEMTKLAKDYLVFFINLRATGGAPGQYPNIP